MGCIYLAVNKINGKAYVGKTSKTLEHRRACHEAMSTCDEGWYFQRAIKKHGKENFEWHEVYSDVPTCDLGMLESECVSWFNTRAPNGYNLSNGGEGNPGYKFTQEQKDHLSRVHKGKPLPALFLERARQANLGKKKGPLNEETKNKISKRLKGRKQTDEHRRKNSQANKGRPKPKHIQEMLRTNTLGWHPSEETLKKMSESQKGRKHTEETKNKMRAAALGRKHTEETKNKLSKHFKGIVKGPPSEETRHNMSVSKKAYYERTKHSRRAGDNV